MSNPQLHPLATLVCAGQASDNPLVIPAVDQVVIRTAAGQMRRLQKVEGIFLDTA